jgi:kinesin family protein 18/19
LKATGCGKTHTISGTDEDPGIIYLTMADLFQRIEDRRTDWDVEVIVTFLEIYNEEIRDLLSDPAVTATPRGGLQIREDKTVKVVGLVELRPKSAEEVKQIVIEGNARRTQSPTHANATSSRSHAVLQVHVTQAPRTANVTEEKTMGTLSIIDLAGSERAAATSNMGQRMVEGANINKSLLALGNCINALCESGGAIRHVPYRNSKLTRLLKFSLGGNCKTVMVVCVAPTSLHFEDTHNTLLYAERATKIKTKVVTRNVVNVDRHVGRYVEAINRLNIEVAELKAKLAGRASGEAEVSKRRRLEASAEVERAKKDLHAKFDQTRPAIVDGASCDGKIAAARSKLATIQRRIGEIDAQARDGPLSADLQAEKALLQALAGPEEAVLRPDSSYNTRLQRSNNSGNMFDATLKAVTERRMDQLDELSVESVRLDSRAIKAELERARAEAREAATREVLEAQAGLLVNLVGMVGRCNVMLGEAGQVLATFASAEGVDALSRVATSLSAVAGQNDQALTSLIGQSTSGYTVTATAPSALDNYKSYSFASSSRQTSASATASASTMPKPKVTRRSSVVPVSPRRGYKSPRRSTRTSLTGTTAPSRRAVVDDKGKKKKSVQWRDDAGHGHIDDAGNDPFYVKPPAVDSSTPGPSQASSSSAPAPVAAEPPRPGSVAGSVAGSESDWEDERSEAGPSSSAASRRAPALAGLTSLDGGAKRRPSRLDPSALKGKAPSKLSSLVEDDGELTPQPLVDRSLNRRDASPSPPLSTLRVPKTHERGHGSPHRRGPAGAGGVKTHVRRRSNVGPIRIEKVSRRRVSAQRDEDDAAAAPPPRAGASGIATLAGPRRVTVDVVKSPAKRAKRVSLLGAAAARSLKTVRQTPLNGFLAPPVAATPDPNSSADISVSASRPSSRAAWR